MQENPFKQTAEIWEVMLTIDVEEQIFLFSEIFESFTESYSVFEKEDLPQKRWEFKGYFSDEDNIKYLQNAFGRLISEHNIENLSLGVSKVDDKDWVLECQQNFKPIQVAKFYIHSSFYKDESKKSDKICVEIDPGRAFGTGEHETTKLCLEAVSNIAQKPSKILDLGCGSGILAIAASKIFTADIMGSDIDDVSIKVAKENAEKNDAPKIKFEVAKGFESDNLQDKYGLIMANILCNPLLDLASDIKKHLLDDGVVILSGFIEEDSQKIIDKYKELGLNLQKKYTQNNWVSLVLSSDKI